MRARLGALVVGVSTSLACGGSPKEPASPAPMALPPLPPSTKPVDNPIASTGTSDDPVRALREPELAPPDRPSFDAAKAAAKSGRLYEAKRLFAHLAIGYPSEPFLADAYNAAVAQIAERQRAAKTSLEQQPLRAIPMPPAGYALARPAKASGPIPKLTKAKETRNQITDDEAWFQANGHSSDYFVPPARDVLFAPGIVSAHGVANTFTGFVYTEYTVSARYAEASLPPEVPLSYGTLPLARAIDAKPYTVAIYGSRVVAVLDPSNSVRALFDFAAWEHPAASKKGAFVVGSASLTTASGTTTTALAVPTESISYDLVFATARDTTLYVGHSNLGYAADSKGLNAYVGAVDMESGDLLWHSAPLVANARDFALVRGAVVCGYGFTAEPDFVFVLDAATGAVRQKIPVKSGPEHFLAKDDGVRVRTYDTDYVFDVR